LPSEIHLAQADIILALKMQNYKRLHKILAILHTFIMKKLIFAMLSLISVATVGTLCGCHSGQTGSGQSLGEEPRTTIQAEGDENPDDCPDECPNDECPDGQCPNDECHDGECNGQKPSEHEGKPHGHHKKLPPPNGKHGHATPKHKFDEGNKKGLPNPQFDGQN
jgi:hypothetical protein